MNGKIEVWKPVIGWPGYEVSDLGRVRSFVKNKRGIILKQANASGRYKCVTLCRDGVKRTKLVHRLVAKAFVSNKYEKPEVNHIDGDRFNNNANNLEWCTSSENQIHAFENNLQSGNNGESNGQSKLTESDVREIRSIYSEGGVLQKDLAEKYGVAKSAICWIIKRKYWTHI